MTKMILTTLTCILFPLQSVQASWFGTSWSALSIPLIAPLLLNNQELMETVNDGLDFYHSREITFDLTFPQTTPQTDMFNDAHTPPLIAHYQMRWGYKGAGDRTIPFTGINGTMHIQIAYDGLSFHLCKSRSLRKKLLPLLAPLTTVTPVQEFYVKLMQLAWTVARSETAADYLATQNSLAILLERLALTPGSDACELYGIPVLPRAGRLSLTDLFHKAPELCTARFIALSQKLESLIAVLTNSANTQEKQRYLESVMNTIDYYRTDAFTCALPRSGSLTLEGIEGGSGDPLTPFTGATLTVSLPAAHDDQIAAFEFELAPEHECFVRLIMLLLHHRKTPLKTYKLTEEISTLCARMSITPSNGTINYMQALLTLLCSYHQSIIHYSFDEPLDHVVDHKEFLMQLVRIIYHAYVLSCEGKKPQYVTDFVTINLGDALRCYRPIVRLRSKAEQATQPGYLEEKGVVIKWELLAAALLQPVPEA